MTGSGESLAWGGKLINGEYHPVNYQLLLTEAKIHLPPAKATTPPPCRKALGEERKVSQWFEKKFHLPSDRREPPDSTAAKLTQLVAHLHRKIRTSLISFKNLTNPQPDSNYQPVWELIKFGAESTFPDSPDLQLLVKFQVCLFLPDALREVVWLNLRESYQTFENNRIWLSNQDAFTQNLWNPPFVKLIKALIAEKVPVDVFHTTLILQSLLLLNNGEKASYISHDLKITLTSKKTDFYSILLRFPIGSDAVVLEIPLHLNLVEKTLKTFKALRSDAFANLKDLLRSLKPEVLTKDGGLVSLAESHGIKSGRLSEICTLLLQTGIPFFQNQGYKLFLALGPAITPKISETLIIRSLPNIVVCENTVADYRALVRNLKEIVPCLSAFNTGEAYGLRTFPKALIQYLIKKGTLKESVGMAFEIWIGALAQWGQEDKDFFDLGRNLCKMLDSPPLIRMALKRLFTLEKNIENSFVTELFCLMFKKFFQDFSKDAALFELFCKQALHLAATPCDLEQSEVATQVYGWLINQKVLLGKLSSARKLFLLSLNNKYLAHADAKVHGLARVLMRKTLEENDCDVQHKIQFWFDLSENGLWKLNSDDNTDFELLIQLCDKVLNGSQAGPEQKNRILPTLLKYSLTEEEWTLFETPILDYLKGIASIDQGSLLEHYIDTHKEHLTADQYLELRKLALADNYNLDKKSQDFFYFLSFEKSEDRTPVARKLLKSLIYPLIDDEKHATAFHATYKCLKKYPEAVPLSLLISLLETTQWEAAKPSELAAILIHLIEELSKKTSPFEVILRKKMVALFDKIKLTDAKLKEVLCRQAPRWIESFSSLRDEKNTARLVLTLHPYLNLAEESLRVACLSALDAITLEADIEFAKKLLDFTERNKILSPSQDLAKLQIYIENILNTALSCERKEVMLACIAKFKEYEFATGSMQTFTLLFNCLEYFEHIDDYETISLLLSLIGKGHPTNPLYAEKVWFHLKMNFHAKDYEKWVDLASQHSGLLIDPKSPVNYKNRACVVVHSIVVEQDHTRIKPELIHKLFKLLLVMEIKDALAWSLVLSIGLAHAQDHKNTHYHRLIADHIAQFPVFGETPYCESFACWTLIIKAITKLQEIGPYRQLVKRHDDFIPSLLKQEKRARDAALKLLMSGIMVHMTDEDLELAKRLDDYKKLMNDLSQSEKEGLNASLLEIYLKFQDQDLFLKCLELVRESLSDPSYFDRFHISFYEGLKTIIKRWPESDKQNVLLDSDLNLELPARPVNPSLVQICSFFNETLELNLKDDPDFGLIIEMIRLNTVYTTNLGEGLLRQAIYSLENIPVGKAAEIVKKSKGMIYSIFNALLDRKTEEVFLSSLPALLKTPLVSDALTNTEFAVLAERIFENIVRVEHDTFIEFVKDYVDLFRIYLTKFPYNRPLKQSLCLYFANVNQIFQKIDFEFYLDTKKHIFKKALDHYKQLTHEGVVDWEDKKHICIHLSSIRKDAISIREYKDIVEQVKLLLEVEYFHKFEELELLIEKLFFLLDMDSKELEIYSQLHKKNLDEILSKTLKTKYYTLASLQYNAYYLFLKTNFPPGSHDVATVDIFDFLVERMDFYLSPSLVQGVFNVISEYTHFLAEDEAENYIYFFNKLIKLFGGICEGPPELIALFLYKLLNRFCLGLPPKVFKKIFVELRHDDFLLMAIETALEELNKKDPAKHDLSVSYSHCAHFLDKLPHLILLKDKKFEEGVEQFISIKKIFELHYPDAMHRLPQPPFLTNLLIFKPLDSFARDRKYDKILYILKMLPVIYPKFEERVKVVGYLHSFILKELNIIFTNNDQLKTEAMETLVKFIGS